MKLEKKAARRARQPLGGADAWVGVGIGGGADRFAERSRVSASVSVTRVEDVGEDTARAAERSRQRIGDGAEDEPPRRQLG